MMSTESVLTLPIGRKRRPLSRHLAICLAIALMASACGSDRAGPTQEAALLFEGIETSFLRGSEIESTDDSTPMASLDSFYDHMWSSYGMTQESVDMNLVVASKARNLVSSIESSELSTQLGGAWLQWSETEVVLRLSFIEPDLLLDEVRALIGEAGLGQDQVSIEQAPVTLDYLRILQGRISSILTDNQVDGWSSWIDQDPQRVIVMGPDTAQIEDLIDEQINEYVIVLEGLFGLT